MDQGKNLCLRNEMFDILIENKVSIASLEAGFAAIHIVGSVTISAFGFAGWMGRICG